MGLTPRVGCLGLQPQVNTYLPRSTLQLALLRDPTDRYLALVSHLDHFCQIEFHLDVQKLLGRAPFGLHPCKRRPGTLSCRRVAVESRPCWCLQGIMPRRSGYFRVGRRVGRSYLFQVAVITNHLNHPARTGSSGLRSTGGSLGPFGLGPAGDT